MKQGGKCRPERRTLMNTSAELRPIFQKSHTLTPHLQISFCLVYIGEAQISAAYTQLDQIPEWPDNMVYPAPSFTKEGTALCRALKIYQPAVMVQDETPAAIFTPLQVDEDYCELTLQRTTRESGKPSIICYREREFVCDEAGKIKEVEQCLFGFDLPHPWHSRRHHFLPNPDYLCLINHRLGTDSDWPDFEPVWIKVRESETSSPLYYKLELVWVDNGGPAVLAVVREFHDGHEEIPETLKSFDQTSRA